jgi:hypothetical protein
MMLISYVYVYIYCRWWVERLYKKDCEYFLLTEGDTCGFVFSNVVISVLFDCMLIDV